VKYEIIGLDAGSADDSRVVYIKMLDGFLDVAGMNQAEALNTALRKARGRYIAWINSDDYYLPNFLDAHLRTFMLTDNPYENEFSVVCSNYLISKEDGSIPFPFSLCPWIFRTRSRSLRKRVVKCGGSIDTLKKRNIIGQPSTLIRTDWLRKVGGWNENLTYAIDYDLWFRLAQVSYFVHVSQTTAVYRVHGENLGVRNFNEQEKEAEGVRSWFADATLKPMFTLEDILFKR